MNRVLAFRQTSKVEITRRAIQHEYLRLLADANFSFNQEDREPWGLQGKVLKAVNKIRYGRDTLSTNRQQVSDWVSRARDNGYQVTSVQQDYSRSSQNRRQSIYSIAKNERISVSESSVRRILKRPFQQEPSMVAAKPKGYRVGGNTAHHNKCRYVEAKYWNSLSQDEINGIWFGDESKMTFREHPNKQIDIQLVRTPTPPGTDQPVHCSKYQWNRAIRLTCILERYYLPLIKHYRALRPKAA